MGHVTVKLLLRLLHFQARPFRTSTRPIHATTLTCVIAQGEWNRGYVPFKPMSNGQAGLGESENENENARTHLFRTCTRPIHATTLTCVIAKGEWNSGYVLLK